MTKYPVDAYRKRLAFLRTMCKYLNCTLSVLWPTNVNRVDVYVVEQALERSVRHVLKHHMSFSTICDAKYGFGSRPSAFNKLDNKCPICESKLSDGVYD